MRDILYVLVLIGFFALTTLFVRACSAIVGATEVDEVATR